MNINIYIEDNIGEQITKYAKTSGKTRNAIIREALKIWLKQHKQQKWPTSIRKFTGIPDAPRFESFRKELKTPKEDPFE